MAQISRNKKTYDSGDVTAFINGVPIYLSKITYSNEQEHQLYHSIGSNHAQAWSAGKITPSCSIGLAMHDSVELEQVAGGSLLNLKPFTITVQFVNDFNIIVVDEIVAKFQNEGREVTGDMALAMEHDLLALSVKLNVGSSI